MSWRCDICDTYNEESVRQCYVCGQPRSAESIREGKIREREERAIRVSQSVYSKGYVTIRIVFISGLSLAVLVTIIDLIIKLSSGSIDEIVTNLTSAASHIYLNFVNNDVSNIEKVAEHLAHAPVHEICMNIDAVLAKWQSALIAFSVLASGLFTGAKNQVALCSNNRVSVIANLLGANVSHLFHTIELLFNSAKDSTIETVSIFKSIMNHVKSFFN